MKRTARKPAEAAAKLKAGVVCAKNYRIWQTAVNSVPKTCWRPDGCTCQPMMLGITYVAFTATPKAKTLELFGRRPNREQAAGEGQPPSAVPCLFHAPSH
jgi:hypothetical protein